MPARRHILVADDELDLLSEVTSFLRRRGETVIEAGSFSAALKAYNEYSGSIGLVLTDVRMPDGSGLDLARWVIEKSAGTCPCLLMSGNLARRALGSDLEAAGVGLVEKPFAMAALYTSMLKVIAAS